MIESVTIGVRRFRVWRDQDAATASEVRGQALLDESKILLDPRLDEHLAAITLLHEAVHCSLEQSPLTAAKLVKGNEPEIDEALEEKIATWLEAFIPQLYRDNRKLFKMLLPEEG